MVITRVFYHLHDRKWTKALDGGCIIALTLYVNMTTSWKPTLPITLSVIIVAAYNSGRHMWPLHVCLVQAPLALCLYFFAAAD